MPIQIHNLTKSFGEKILFRGLTLEIPDGAVCCLMAPSGYGKTTLLRILMGLEEPDSGEITGLKGRTCAPVFQEDRLCENLSAGANIRMVMPRESGSANIPAELEALELSDTLHSPARLLSGGQRRRIALARALLSGRDILLLDEPFQGLDHQTRERAAAYARDRARGRTMIVVTHDEDEAALLGGRIIPLDALGV